MNFTTQKNQILIGVLGFILITGLMFYISSEIRAKSENNVNIQIVGNQQFQPSTTYTKFAEYLEQEKNIKNRLALSLDHFVDAHSKIKESGVEKIENYNKIDISNLDLNIKTSKSSSETKSDKPVVVLENYFTPKKIKEIDFDSSYSEILLELRRSIFKIKISELYDCRKSDQRSKEIVDDKLNKGKIKAYVHGKRVYSKEELRKEQKRMKNSAGTDSQNINIETSSLSLPSCFSDPGEYPLLSDYVETTYRFTPFTNKETASRLFLLESGINIERFILIRSSHLPVVAETPIGSVTKGNIAGLTVYRNTTFTDESKATEIVNKKRAYGAYRLFCNIAKNYCFLRNLESEFKTIRLDHICSKQNINQKQYTNKMKKNKSTQSQSARNFLHFYQKLLNRGCRLYSSEKVKKELEKILNNIDFARKQDPERNYWFRVLSYPLKIKKTDPSSDSAYKLFSDIFERKSYVSQDMSFKLVQKQFIAFLQRLQKISYTPEGSNFLFQKPKKITRREIKDLKRELKIE